MERIRAEEAPRGRMGRERPPFIIEGSVVGACAPSAGSIGPALAVGAREGTLTRTDRKFEFTKEGEHVTRTPRSVPEALELIEGAGGRPVILWSRARAPYSGRRAGLRARGAGGERGT